MLEALTGAGPQSQPKNKTPVEDEPGKLEECTVYV